MARPTANGFCGVTGASGGLDGPRGTHCCAACGGLRGMRRCGAWGGLRGMAPLAAVFCAAWAVYSGSGTAPQSDAVRPR
jgi:hypothetical protein